MSLTVNIYYTAEGNNAHLFAEEMIKSGLVDKIRAEKGNLRYEYFFPQEDEHGLLLIDSWENQEALDYHHSTIMMQEIIKLLDKYNITMKVQRFIPEEEVLEKN